MLRPVAGQGCAARNARRTNGTAADLPARCALAEVAVAPGVIGELNGVIGVKLTTLRSPKLLKRWSGRRGSNPRRPAWEAGILPLNYSRLPFFASTYLLLKHLGRSTASLFRLLRPSKTMGFDRKMDSKVDSKPVWEAFASALLVYCPLYCPSHDRFNISHWTFTR